ncbi:MAG: aldehyde ferredoxin oxidoreductase, partial [Thermoproteota archaeon]
MWPMIYYYDDFAPWLKALTGIEELGSEKKLALAGERIYMLRRAFNAREGVGKEADTLNPRFTEEPMPEGPGKGQVVELEVMLREYYEYRGLDWETGWPKRAKLEELGLGDVADELGRLGKLAE